MNAKERLREEIAAHVKNYLDAGGLIELVPPRRYVPACYEWMLDFGWDYERSSSITFKSPTNYWSGICWDF